MAGIFDQAAAQFSNRMLNGQSELIPKTLGGRIDSTIQDSWDGKANAEMIALAGAGGNKIFDTLANREKQNNVAFLNQQEEQLARSNAYVAEREVLSGLRQVFGDRLEGGFDQSNLVQYKGNNEELASHYSAIDNPPASAEQQDNFRFNLNTYTNQEIGKLSGGTITNASDYQNLLERAEKGDIDPRLNSVMQALGPEKFRIFNSTVKSLGRANREMEIGMSSVLNEDNQNKINRFEIENNRKSVDAALDLLSKESKAEHEMVSNQELSRQSQMLPELSAEAEAKKEQMMMALELIKSGKSPAEAKIIASQYMNANGGSSNFMGSGQGSGNGSGFIPKLGSGGSGSGQGSGDGDYDFGLKGDGAPTETTTNTNGIPVSQGGQGYNGTDLNLSGIRTRQGFDPNDYERSVSSLSDSQRKTFYEINDAANQAEQSGADPEYVRKLRNDAAYYLATGRKSPALRRSNEYNYGEGFLDYANGSFIKGWAEKGREDQVKKFLGMKESGIPTGGIAYTGSDELSSDISDFNPKKMLEIFDYSPENRQYISDSTYRRLKNLAQQPNPAKSHTKEMKEVQRLLHNELYEPNRFNKPIEQTQQQVTQQSNSSNGKVSTTQEAINVLEQFRRSGGNKPELLGKLPKEQIAAYVDYMNKEWSRSKDKTTKQAYEVGKTYFSTTDVKNKTNDATLDKRINGIVGSRYKNGYKIDSENSVTQSKVKDSLSLAYGVFDGVVFNSGGAGKPEDTDKVIKGFYMANKALKNSLKVKGMGNQNIDQYVAEHPDITNNLTEAFPDTGQFHLGGYLEQVARDHGIEGTTLNGKYARRFIISMMNTLDGNKITQTNITNAFVKNVSLFKKLKAEQENSGK